MTALSREAIEALRSPLAVRVDFHEEIDSTQRRARELARADTPHGTLVISEVQTGGRGRLGRRWGSPKGGLWFSLVLRPALPAHLAPRITQTAAVGIAKALQSFGVEARIKWPNDLLVAHPGEPEKKVCGILAESGTEGSPNKGPAAESLGPGYSIALGVGLNANLDPGDLAVPDREVTTLRSELGRDVDLVELLGALLSNLDAELARLGDFGAVLDGWRASNLTLGRLVRARRFGEDLVGRAVDLTPEGALLLETSRGTVELFEGEVEHLRQEDA